MHMLRQGDQFHLSAAVHGFERQILLHARPMKFSHRPRGAERPLSSLPHIIQEVATAKPETLISKDS